MPAKGQQTPVNLDTPAGLVHATAHLNSSSHVERVSFLYEAVIPEVSGTAYITGRHEFIIDPGDKLGRGFLFP